MYKKNTCETCLAFNRGLSDKCDLSWDFYSTDFRQQNHLDHSITFIWLSFIVYVKYHINIDKTLLNKR